MLPPLLLLARPDDPEPVAPAASPIAVKEEEEDECVENGRQNFPDFNSVDVVIAGAAATAAGGGRPTVSAISPVDWVAVTLWHRCVREQEAWCGGWSRTHF